MLTVFWFELKRNLRRKGYLFTTFGIPLLALILVFGIHFINTMNADDGSEGDTAEETIDFGALTLAGLVDESGLIETIPSRLEPFIVQFDTVEAAEAAMLAGEVDAYYRVPADYIETGEVVEVLPRLEIGAMSGGLIEQVLTANFTDGSQSALMTRLGNPANIQSVNLSRSTDGVARDASQAEDADFLVVYIFVIVFLLAIFMTNGYLMQSVIEEKETRLIEILISTLRPFQLLSGKVLAMGLLGIMQMGVWLATLIFIIVVGSELSGLTEVIPLDSIIVPWDRIPILLIYFVLGYMFFAVLFGAVGALSDSMQEGPQIAVIFTLPAAMPFYFFPLFLSTPNAPLAVGLSMFPLTSPISMTMRLMVTAVPVIEILISLGLLLLAVIGAAWISARLFRVQILLRGQRPKVRDIPRLIFSDSGS